MVLVLPDALSVPDARAHFEQLPEVETVEPDYEYRAHKIPNDPLFEQEWGLKNTGQSGGKPGIDIGAPNAWEHSIGSANVYIGIIDTGIDYRHRDLAPNVWTNPREIPGNGIDDDGDGWIDDIHGIDPLANRLNPDIPDADPLDEEGHGTHVAGTIAAAGNDGMGTVGVMWRANLIACRFLDAWGHGLTSDALACLDYFAMLKEQGVDIVATNNSWGGGEYSQLLYDAIKHQGEIGILFVASAGNDAQDQDTSPSYPDGFDLDNIISVAALGPDGKLAQFSNFGVVTVDIAAPGVDVLSTLPRDQYGFGSGTSMAAPHVTGVLGLLKSKFPKMTAADLKNWVLTTGASAPELQGLVRTGARLIANVPIRDEDGDGMDDDWELSHGLDPMNPADGALDPDADGLTNVREFAAGSDPHVADSDGDGLLDGAEVDVYGTSPTAADTDGDGLRDADEINQYHTNPRAADSDGDGLTDAAELQTTGTDPLKADTDGDGAGDGWEVTYGLNPKDAQDGTRDTDGDGLTNAQEFAAGSNPNVRDTDGDGLDDRAEVMVYRTNPARVDSDDDGMPDGWEVTYGLNPNSAADATADRDNDGYSNLAEFRVKTDPTDSASAPTVPAWSTLMGGPAHTGNVPLDTRTEQFSPRWVGQFANELTPTVTSGEQIFLALTSRSLADGSLRWRTALPNGGIPGTPAVMGGAVFSLVNGPAGSELYSFAESDGHVLYHVPVTFHWVAPYLTPHNGRLFLNAHDDNSNLVLLSIDAGTGAILWQTTLDPGGLSSRALVVTDDYVIDYESTTLYVLDRNTGQLVFRNSEAKCDADTGQMLFDGSSTLYAYTPYCIEKFDLAARKLVWERVFLSGVIGLSLDDRYLYAASYFSVRAIEPADGVEVWQFWVPDEGIPAVELLLPKNIVTTLDHVLVSGPRGTFFLDRLTGKLDWHFGLGGNLAVGQDGGLVISSPNAFAVINMTGDRDGDGMPDWWEKHYGLDPGANDAAQDADGDGLTNLEEYTKHADPRKADTDGDGLADGAEVHTYGTSPTLADSDHDGLGDGEEVSTRGTSPTRADSDGDGFSDYEEVVLYHTDPNSAASTPSLARPAFATDVRHVLAAGDGYLHEFMVTGQRVGGAVPIPNATDTSDLVVLPDHRIAIADLGGRMQIFDPATSLWYAVPFEWGAQGGRVGMAATSEYIVATNPGAVRGLVRFDLNGEFLDRQLIGVPYDDLAVGADGYVYALRVDAGYVDQIDPHAFSIVRSVRLDGARAFTLGPDGAFYAVGNLCSSQCAYSLTKYDSAGHKIANTEVPWQTPGTGILYDIDYLPGDMLAVGLPAGLAVASAKLGLPRNIEADSAPNYAQPLFVAKVMKEGVDSDGDGLPDWWERVHGLNPADSRDATQDLDADGLTNLAEFAHDTDPRSADTDGDGLADGREVNTLGTDPVLADTDGDGLNDGAEVDTFHTLPTNADTDGDGLSDGDEVATYGTDPLRADTDGDGQPDGYEVRNGFDPRDAADGQQDSDGDHLSNREELAAGTDPFDPDTDHDGLSDGDEVKVTHTNPLNRDSDGDRIWDDWEVKHGLDPNDPSDAGLDPDGDGFDNLTEYFADTDPRRAESVPVVRPWITRGGNPAHTGYVPVHLRPTEFTLYWSQHLATTDSTSLDEAVAENGLVFVTAVSPNVNRGEVVALDGVTGAVLWRYEQPTASDHSPPALSGDKVFVQTATPASVLALDRLTGAVVIQHGLDEGGPGYDLMAPTPFGGRIYIGAAPLVGISALDAADGTELWHTILSGSWAGAEPAVDATNAYLFMSDSLGHPALFVVDRQNGARRKGVLDPGPAGYVSATVLGRRNDVLASQISQLVKIDRLTSAFAWKVPGYFAGSPAVANGVVYAIDNGALVAVSEDTGVELWRWLGAGVGRISNSPLATIDHVFVSSATTTYAIDLKTHAPVWSVAHGGALSLGNDRILYIADPYSDLHAIATFADADRDGMADDWELAHGMNPADPTDAARDLDGDGLSNRMEFMLQTQVGSKDSDGDGVDDGSEVLTYKSDPLNGDTDGDGVSDSSELTHHTDPLSSDSDHDGLPDGDELTLYGTNPLAADTDGDGFDDGWELRLGSDPADANSKPTLIKAFSETFESGRVPSTWENAADSTTGWNVVTVDATSGHVLRSMPIGSYETAAIRWDGYFMEGDLSFSFRYSSTSYVGALALYIDDTVTIMRPTTLWTTFRTHIAAGLHRIRWETRDDTTTPILGPTADIDNVAFAATDGDADGLPDAWELAHGLNPLDPADANADSDGDGLTNAQEFALGTLPESADTDADGMPDGWEVRYRLNPKDPADAARDLDRDGTANVAEYRAGTDPTDAASAPPPPPTPSPPPPPTPPPPPPPAQGGGGGGGGGAADAWLLGTLALAWLARARRNCGTGWRSVVGSETKALRRGFAALLVAVGLSSCSGGSTPTERALSPGGDETTSSGSNAPSGDGGVTSSGSVSSGDSGTTSSGTNVAQSPPPASAAAADDMPVSMSTCPANGDAEVGVNTLISVSVTEPLDATTLGDNPLTLTCAGGAVAGTSTYTNPALEFTPSLGLVRSADCTVSLAPTIRTVSGRSLPTASWSFSTANVEARWFHYDAPVKMPLTEATGTILRGMAAEGSQLALSWSVADVLNISTSRDGGRTFANTPIRVGNTEFGLIDGSDLLIHNGVLHSAWRVLPEDIGRIFYTRSTTDIGHFQPLTLIGAPANFMTDYSPSIAIGTNGNTYVAWERGCELGAEAYCSRESLGIFIDIISPDLNVSPTSVQLAAGSNLFSPKIAWVKDHLAVAWMDFNHYQISVGRYDGTFANVATVTSTGGQPWLDTFRSVGDKAVLFWREDSAMQNQEQYTAQYDGALRTLTPPAHLATLQQRYPRYTASAIGVAPDGKVLWVLGIGDSSDPNAPATRKAYFSEDGGAHFFAPQPLQFMLPNSNDDLVPLLAVTSDPIVYAVLGRASNRVNVGLYVARGVPVSPCAP